MASHKCETTDAYQVVVSNKCKAIDAYRHVLQIAISTRICAMITRRNIDKG